MKNKSASDFITAYKISNDFTDLQEAIKYADIANETDKNEINKLKAEYDDALDNSRYELAIKNRMLPNFIIEYPQSKHIQSAKNIIDDEAFNEAKNKNKIRDFVKKHPDSAHISEANKIIRQEEWENIIANKCKGQVMDMLSFLRDSNPFTDKGKCVKIIAGKFQITSSTSGLFNILRDNLVYIEFPTEFRGYLTQGLVRIKGQYSYVTQLGSYNSVPHLEMLMETQ